MTPVPEACVKTVESRRERCYIPRVSRIRILVQYDGSEFCGWQRQKGVRTVQRELEDAIERFTGSPTVVRGAGRTDAGVHAHCQVAAFDTAASIPPRGWVYGLTSLLPHDVSVLEARVVSGDYDPRRMSGGKRYRYLLLLRAIRDPLLRNRAWCLHDRLDVAKLRGAASVLVGTHDFAAYRASDCERKSTVRTLFRVNVVESYGSRSDVVAIEVEGTAFLKNMVRVITGTLVDVARGRLPSERPAELLTSGDRTRAGVTAPAHGLYLDEVFVRPEFRLPDDSLRVPPVRDAG